MHSALLLPLQISVILIVSRAVGWLFGKVRQPQVVGDMVTGIMLGPSLLGWLWPKGSAALFSSDSLIGLQSLSQIGLIFFMFLVGLEVDPKLFRGKRKTAIAVSYSGILVPFFLGIILAYFLFPRFSNNSVRFEYFAIFVGTAMSITAFPVLARILAEDGLLRTPLGALAIGCAAVDDVTGWWLLATVVILIRAGNVSLPLWMMISGSCLFAGGMWFVVRPFLQRLGHRRVAHDPRSKGLLVLVLVFVLLSACVTEGLGIHALFGAFLAGSVIPKNKLLLRELSEKLEGMTVSLFLPLFFALVGLKTSIGLLSGPGMWFWGGVVVLVAVTGKLGGCMLTARACGLAWREACALGVLMNTRGLMELVVLSIGFEVGIISTPLFTMFVLMALVTTLMTKPILRLIPPVMEKVEGYRDDRSGGRTEPSACDLKDRSLVASRD